MSMLWSYIWDKKVQHLFYLIPTITLILISIYPDQYKTFSIWIQVLTIILSAASVYFASSYPAIIDSVKYKRIEKNIENLQNQIKDHRTKITHYEELKTLLVKFLDNSGIYREKVIDLLNLEDDYLCIAKSSEGLSDVFVEKEGEKEMLPFSKVLYEWPGALKPFERMSLYLIPLKNLPGMKKENLRQYINSVIVPKVEKERQKFLDSLPRKTAKLADEFSYKYIAVVIKGSTLVYDVKNRKFIKQFVDSFVTSGSRKNIAKYTKILGEVIGLKEFFLRVEWNAFADLNKKQGDLIEMNKGRIYTDLKRAGISSLSEMYAAGPDKITKLLCLALGSNITEKRASNIARKLMEGAGHVIETLAKAGIGL